MATSCDSHPVWACRAVYVYKFTHKYLIYQQIRRFHSLPKLQLTLLEFSSYNTQPMQATVEQNLQLIEKWSLALWKARVKYHVHKNAQLDLNHSHLTAFLWEQFECDTRRAMVQAGGYRTLTTEVPTRYKSHVMFALDRHGAKFFSKHLDLALSVSEQLWGQHRLIQNGYQVPFPDVKRPGSVGHNPPRLALRLKKVWIYTSTIPLCLHGRL
jgi:hypothetical protein